MRWLACLVGFTQILSSAVVIDRIAVIAGKHAIKASDIDRDVRLTAFLNREPLNVSLDTRRKSVQRLIDQTIIRDEISTGGYARSTDSEADTTLAQLRRDRFAGSDLKLRQSLTQYGVSEMELRDLLLWQLTVLRFIDERFRPGVIVTEEEVRNYYNERKAELDRQNPGKNGLSAVEARVRETVEGEKINQQFEAWLDDARKNQRIQFVEKDLS